MPIQRVVGSCYIRKYVSGWLQGPEKEGKGACFGSEENILELNKSRQLSNFVSIPITTESEPLKE